MWTLRDGPNGPSETATEKEKELQIRPHQTEWKVLRTIDEALARIEQVPFGVCAACKPAIAKARLDAVPWTPLCRDCEEQGSTPWGRAKSLNSGIVALSRNSTSNSRQWNKLHMQGGSLFGDAPQLLLPVFDFIELDSSVHVLVAELQHPVKKAGEHVRHGRYSFGCAESGAQPAELGS